jgi:hypothetical protein
VRFVVPVLAPLLPGVGVVELLLPVSDVGWARTGLAVSASPSAHALIRTTFFIIASLGEYSFKRTSGGSARFRNA